MFMENPFPSLSYLFNLTSIFFHIWFEDQLPEISAVHDASLVPRGVEYWAKKVKRRE